MFVSAGQMYGSTPVAYFLKFNVDTSITGEIKQTLKSLRVHVFAQQLQIPPEPSQSLHRIQLTKIRWPEVV